jgi:hypothetical protein
MTRLSRMLVLGGLLSLSTPLVAHHSFATYYLEDDTLEIEGDVIEFEYKNPHSWVQVKGRDAFGRGDAIYSAEWASVSRLEREGINARTLRTGDVVRIWASPNRNPSDNRVRLKRIERRADHWSWGQTRQENSRQ